MMRTTRWMAVAAAAAVVLTACGGGDDDADASPDDATEVETTDGAATDAAASDVATSVATTEAEPADSATTVASSAPAPAEPAVFIADAEPITERFSPVDPGTHRVDTLGTPFTFTIEEPMFVQPNGLGSFVLTHAMSQGPDDRDIVFLRLSALSDPTDPAVEPAELGTGWPPSDFAGWIDELSDALVVSNREDTSLGGRPATRIDVEVGDHDCGPGSEFCLLFGTNHGLVYKDFFPRSQYRVWVVDQRDEDPVAVIVGVNRESDVGFFDTADAVLSTLAFGEVAPNPIFEAPAGPVELPFLGGIRIELADPALVIQEQSAVGAIAAVDDVPGDTEFLDNPTTVDGEAIRSSDELVAALEAGNVEITEIEPTTVGGLEARVFEIGASGGPPLLLRSLESGRDWRPPPRGRLWLVEHPERGLLMTTAEVFADPDEAFPAVLAQTETIVRSMEFIDLDSDD